MKRLAILALLISLYASMSYGDDQPRSLWSQDAKTFKATKDGAYEPVLSPDGKVAFSFDGRAFVFRDAQGSDLATFGQNISTPDLVETGWSSDSREVFVNASDGGAMGTWNTSVFQQTDAGFREIQVENLIKRVSALKTDCQFKNVVAVGWINAQRDLLVLEQVPDSSGCSNMGKLVGYIVEVSPLKVLERLSAEQVNARFGARLGNQGKAAAQ